MSLYAFTTRPMLERRAQRDLLEANVNAYAPSVRRWRTTGHGARVRHDMALLPGYVFVATGDPAAAFQAVRRKGCVKKILSCNGEPSPIPSAWLESYLALQSFGAFDYTLDRKPKLTVGQLVRIISGQFQGVMAKVTREEKSGVMGIYIGAGIFKGPTTIEPDKLRAA